MHISLSYQGKNEIGAFIRMTNTYVIVGSSKNKTVLNFFQENVNCPIIEATINSTWNIGVQSIGNSKGLVLPDTCTDQELIHIRNRMPDNIKVARIEERWNCLGNIMLCNDHIGIIHPSVCDETIALLEEVLEIPIYKRKIGDRELVGTYAVANNRGMLVYPGITENEMRELGELTNMRVIAGTVNNGYSEVGGGMVVNDWLQISGMKTTPVEIAVLESVFNCNDNTNLENVIADEII